MGMAFDYKKEYKEFYMHHEIYLSDTRKIAPERLKTVVRHPIRRV